MARLAETVIEQIKQEISLVRLAESQGHQLKKHGKDYALNCPFHEDRTASLIITPTSNLWHRMGECQQGGSVIDWVMKSQGVSFRFACELLQQDLGLVLDAGTKASKQNTTTKLPPPLAANADNQTALKQVIDYYHETLKQSPEAQEYLRSRGLAHPELIERFKLGGRQINFHAVDRMVNPPRGRSGMSAAEVDEVHDGATNVRKTFFHPDHSSKTYRHQALVLM